MHQEKLQQEKLKAVKARLNFMKDSQNSESGTPSRRRDLRNRLGSRHVRSVSGVPNQDTADLNHQGKEVQKESRCLKGWRRELAAEIMKAITKAPAREEQVLRLRETIEKEIPSAGRKPSNPLLRFPKNPNA
ncbi:hypothetical protein Tco_1433091 [Tanacetum coccineum]